MMQRLLNTMRMQSAMQASMRASPRFGVISSYDPVNYCAKVRLQPEDLITGWLPVLSPWVGNGWGMFVPPSIGDMVQVNFEDNDHEAGFVSLSGYNDNARPLTVQSGEFWLVHKLGAFVKLTNDGKLTVTDKAGSTVILNGDGTGTASFTGGLTVNANTQINGTLIVSGNISDQNGTKGTLQHVRDNYDAHTHGGIATGAGTTSTPSNSL